MTRRAAASRDDLREVLIETWAVNERINQILLEHLDARAWRAKPPAGKGRTIAAIITHVHNVRRKWLRLTAPRLKLPAELERSRCTQRQAQAALAESGRRCSEMLADALGGGRVRKFRRDGWLPSWPAGGTMFAYMLAHEAHHRGQVLQLAHQLGFPLSGAAASQLWRWEKLWKECGFGTRPR
jgi:uncharacterized damage-inducible protein DinB